MWIKPSTQQDVAPLLTMAIPYSAALKEEENATEYEISETGSIFSFELTNGWPKMAGSRAYLSNDKVNTGEWSHLVGIFSDSGNQLWLNGRRLSVQSSQSQTEDRFAELTNLLDLSADAELFSVGKSYSRTDDPLASSPSEIFFNGLVDDLSIYDRVLTNAEIQYLYELRRGREQIPRLEAVVDAVGTVTVNEGGEGYRENPDLVFWYGSDKEFENNLTTFTSMADADSHYKDLSGDYNGSLGELVLIDSSEDSERGVWSFHQGKDPGRSYNWSKINEDNGWRRHISAQDMRSMKMLLLAMLYGPRKWISPPSSPCLMVAWFTADLSIMYRWI